MSQLLSMSQVTPVVPVPLVTAVFLLTKVWVVNCITTLKNPNGDVPNLTTMSKFTNKNITKKEL